MSTKQFNHVPQQLGTSEMVLEPCESFSISTTMIKVLGLRRHTSKQSSTNLLEVQLYDTFKTLKLINGPEEKVHLQLWQKELLR